MSPSLAFLTNNLHAAAAADLDDLGAKALSCLLGSTPVAPAKAAKAPVARRIPQVDCPACHDSSWRGTDGRCVACLDTKRCSAGLAEVVAVSARLEGGAL